MTLCKKEHLRAFTLMELMIAVVIITLIVSFASVGYSRYRDRAAMLVDETNEKVLLAAVKLYAYDTNALPGSLSQLRPDQIERAYALVTEGKRPYTLLAFLEEKLGLFEIAEAASLPDRYLGENPLRVLTCPTDSTPPDRFPAPTQHSYGITTGVNGAANKPLRWLLDPQNGTLPIVVESDVANPSSASLADVSFRHNGKRTSVQVTAEGNIERFLRPGGGHSEQAGHNDND